MDIRSIVAGVAFATSIGATAFAADGNLDPAFGDAGIALAGLGAFELSISPGTMVVQPDGKIVLCGTVTSGGATGKDFIVTRLTRDGALDTDFSFDGHASIDFDGGAESDSCAAVAVQPDGKIIVAGGTSTDFFNVTFAIARLDAHGTLDAGFGNGGKVKVAFDNRASASAIGVQSNGAIVVVGSDVDPSTNYATEVAVVRLTPDGVPDPAFNSTGQLEISYEIAGFPIDFGYAVHIDDEDRIVIVGVAGDTAQTDYRIGLMRLLPDGAPDPNFDADGRTTVDFDFGSGPANAQATSLALQADGRVVVAGYADTSGTNVANDDIVAARFLPDGSLDATFGSGGRTRLGLDLGGGDLDGATSIVVQPNGRIVLAGLSQGTADNILAIAARFLPDGSTDPDFGSAGHETYQFHLASPFVQSFSSLAMQGNHIIAAGIVHVPGSASAYDQFAVRLVNDLLFANAFE